MSRGSGAKMDGLGPSLADAVFCSGGCGRTFLVAVGYLDRYTCEECRPAIGLSRDRRRKLTDEQIALALEETANIRQLAERFGVTTGALYRYRQTG